MMEDYYNFHPDNDDDANPVQEQDGRQQFQYDFSSQPEDEVDDGDDDDNLFSVDHYTDAATYDESIAIAAAFADPAQPPQSLALLQQQAQSELKQAQQAQSELKQASKKKIVGYVYKKAPAAPKRWKSSYIHFYNNFVEKKKKLFVSDGLTRRNNAKTQPSEFDMIKISKESSKAWKELPANEKKYWDSISQKEKEEYEKKLGEFDGSLQVRTDVLKKKDLGAPKRSPSAFFLFVKQKGPKLKDLNPNVPSNAIVKECGKLWRSMSESEKKPFKEEEQALRKEYKIEKEKWIEAKKKEELEAREKLEEERLKLLPLLQGDYLDVVAAAVVAAAALPVENVVNPEYESVVQPVVNYSDNSLERPRVKKRKGYDGNLHDDVPKRPPSSFFIFCSHCRPKMKVENPELSYKESIKKLSAEWAAMTDEQKKPFRDLEEELREQYYFKMAHYRRNKKKNIKLKGGVDDQLQSEFVAEEVENPFTHVTQESLEDSAEQERQRLSFAPLADDNNELVNYRQDINYHEENTDYHHDLSYADYNIEPINVSAAKSDDGQDENGEYNQHHISHQASIDYGAVGEYFGL